MNWMILWKWILIITIALYGILVVIVAIGGFRDAMFMLKELTGNQTEDVSGKKRLN